MKVQFEAELIREEEGALTLRLETGFGNPVILATKESVVFVDSPDPLHKARLEPGSWEEVEAVVEAFKQAMLRKLKKNQHKGNRPGWMKDNNQALQRRVVEEVNELGDELMLPIERPEAILDEAADVANMAMMVADSSGAIRLSALEVVQEKPTPPPNRTVREYLR